MAATSSLCVSRLTVSKRPWATAAQLSSPSTNSSPATVSVPSAFFAPGRQEQAQPWQKVLKQQHWHWAATQPRRIWQVCGSIERQRDLENIERSLPDFEELDKDDLRTFLELELESSFNFEDSRHYEIMFMVHENSVDVVADVIKEVEAFIAEQKGKVWRLNEWGLRRLAYKIKKATQAYYVLMNVEINSQSVNQLNTLLEKDERVIRHMCMSQKEAITEATEAPPNYFPESKVEAEGHDDNDGSDSEEDSEVDSELDTSEDEGEEEFIEGQGRCNSRRVKYIHMKPVAHWEV